MKSAGQLLSRRAFLRNGLALGGLAAFNTACGRLEPAATPLGSLLPTEYTHPHRDCYAPANLHTAPYSHTCKFATGTPELDLWQEFFPALRAAHEHNGALALHEYSAPVMQFGYGSNQLVPGADANDEGWLTLRYRSFGTAGRAPTPGNWRRGSRPAF